MTGALVIIVGVIVLIMVHEAGHFLAARAVGMKATEFFFGFGPRLWSVRRGETEYGVKALPLGGYVRIAGMNPYEEVAPEDVGRTYREKPFWAKSVVVLAGGATHLVLAFLLYYMVFTVIGVDSGQPTTRVAAVSTTGPEAGLVSPAAEAGIRPGDVIVELGGVAVPTWDDLVAAIVSRPGATVPVVVERDGARLELAATLAAVRDDDGTRGWLGVSPAGLQVRAGPIEGVGEAGGAVVDAVSMSARGMWGLFRNLGTLVTATFQGDQETIDQNRPLSLVGLGRLGAQTQQYGLAFTFELLALIYVFLAIFNLLPVYPLDGGHFVVALYEKIRGRAPDVRKLAPIAGAVVAFIVLLGLFALYLDIARPFEL